MYSKKLMIFTSLVPRLSFSEGRRESGNINWGGGGGGGVKPLTSGTLSFM